MALKLPFLNFFVSLFLFFVFRVPTWVGDFVILVYIFLRISWLEGVLGSTPGIQDRGITIKITNSITPKNWGRNSFCNDFGADGSSEDCMGGGK